MAEPQFVGKFSGFPTPEMIQDRGIPPTGTGGFLESN
jgi:hypothetical protein